MKLEEIRKGMQLRGILQNQEVTVIEVEWIGTTAVDLIYRTSGGYVDQQLVFRDQEDRLKVVQREIPWSFAGDGATFRLVSEAVRIELAYLFDARMAVHTSNVKPLPHQLSAVYEEMLPRQPLRFLLADDPGAGKTIMAGLLIKELMARGAVERCLIVCPGSLEEQWHAELMDRFGLNFQVMTNEKLQTSRGNWFAENDLVLGRLHKLAWDEHSRNLLQNESARWDLVVCDEAHKMSAKAYGNRVESTKCYTLGMLLSKITHHFLLMTATPHNGKEADFQLFMRLIDPDRFAGIYKEGTGMELDASDLMRRVVKEKLLTFEGKPLFPERRAFTIRYELAESETELYEEVTQYVRTEYNRAEALREGRKNNIGFALTLLQRRLASSPQAILHSLERRQARLQEKLDEMKRGLGLQARANLNTSFDFSRLEDAPEAERAAKEDEVLCGATAAQSTEELNLEIRTLKALQRKARAVLSSRTDTKWQELSNLLHEKVFQPRSRAQATTGKPQKLVIFTEHVDTLDYLVGRIWQLFGTKAAVVQIHGSLNRKARLRAQEEFRNNPDVKVLVATDAAGEGINLQYAHLMVNYDLPWNPNRLEQRFGRIHRIGQTEVCHLWNLVAKGTREGLVYETLLAKLEKVSQALGGQVFDVLGKLDFDGRSLRDLLIEAIRYGDRPDVRKKLHTVVDGVVSTENLRRKYEQTALVEIEMDSSTIRAKREEMQRAYVRRLQPHYVEAFFREAFKQAGAGCIGGSSSVTRSRMCRRCCGNGLSARPMCHPNTDESLSRDCSHLVQTIPTSPLSAPGIRYWMH